MEMSIRHNIILILLLALCSGTSAQTSAHFGAAKFIPPTGKKLLIVGQDLGAVGGLTNYNEGYIDNLNQIPGGVTTYVSLSNLIGLESHANWGSGDIQAQQYINDQNFDQSALAIGLHISGGLNSIIDGFRDGNIERLAKWIKTSDRPVFLRIGYEFDGPWNNHNPERFKQSWIRIVKIFDQEDVTNVAYVWQSAGINTPSIERWYPGDEYVNWVGYSHFDQSKPGDRTLEFALEHNKPVMIAEATPRRDLKAGSSLSHWNLWYQPLFDKIYANDQIKALAYINVNWDIQSMWMGQGWGDSRVQVNDFVKGKWLIETENENWLISTDKLFDQLGYSLWRDSVYVLNVARHEDKLKGSLSVKIKKNNNELLVSTISEISIDQVQIFSLDGKNVFSSTIPNKHHKISLNRIKENQILILNLLIGDHIITQKINFRSL